MERENKNLDVGHLQAAACLAVRRFCGLTPPLLKVATRWDPLRPVPAACSDRMHFLPFPGTRGTPFFGVLAESPFWMARTKLNVDMTAAIWTTPETAFLTR